MKSINFQTNRIYHGDNMYYMRDMPSECIDLIYIDPPFGTQSLWKSNSIKRGFGEFQFYDMWDKKVTGVTGVNGYINFMVERLRHMHRLLKPTGSLFVHLDWRMAHYIKIELDKIFGVTNPASSNTNFVNEIIWHYKTGGASGKSFARKHDTLLFYSKDYKKKQFFAFKEKNYTKAKNRKPGRQNYGQADCDFFEDENGVYNLTYIKDVWDIPYINSQAKERTGWPTQKPLKLLDRIITATTKKNDLVADFFCGCGTSVVSAQRLERKWIGFDASMTACEVMLDRIKEDEPLFNQNIIRKPMSGADFRRLRPLDFEKEAVRYIGGVTNHAQIGDGGIDGRLAFDGTPIQVKKEKKPLGDTDRFRAFYEPMKQHGRGIYITLNGFSLKAKERASGWRREGLDIQLLTIKDILAGKFREQPLKKSA